MEKPKYFHTLIENLSKSSLETLILRLNGPKDAENQSFYAS